MEYHSLICVDEDIKRDLIGQINSLFVLGQLNGFKVEEWQSGNRITLNFKKKTNTPLVYDTYAVGLMVFIKNNKILFIECQECTSIIAKHKILAKSKYLRYSDGELSKPIKLLIEKLGE